MNDLRQVEREPDYLLEKGYVRQEQETTDVVRWVWYEKVLESAASQVRLVVQVEFELAIHDDWAASYEDNHQFAFNGVYLLVYDRQMDRLDSTSYDEETAHPRYVGRRELRIHTLSQLEAFCEKIA